MLLLSLRGKEILTMGNKDYESNVEELIAKLNKLTRAVELFEEENRNLEAAKEELALAKKNFSVYEDTLKHLKENQKEAEQRLEKAEESMVDKVGASELEKVRESLSLDLSKLREEIKNFEFREGGISNGSILKLVERVERIDDELKKNYKF
jgi:chromosome segregation ATPase